ncbi:MAG: energy transducer TonB, partial [Acidobacteriota bacterium]|nr:energy transducer TonB [Acidobacteriota bacterium]
ASLFAVPASAQPSDCSVYSVRGLATGMGYREVWDVMGGKGDVRGVETGPNGAVSYAVYQVEPTPLRLRYDREISKKKDDARLVMIETKAGLLLESLVERLGQPDIGAEQIAGGRPRSAIVWTNEVCNVEVTVYPSSEGWWQPAQSKMNVRVRALTLPTARAALSEPSPNGAPSASAAAPPESTTASVTLPPEIEGSAGSEGPYLAGVGGVTFPERIEKLYVEPAYPPVALKGDLGGRVLLQAVILKDGTVAEVSVLSSSRPGYGFEEAAIEAVKQWRYRPATLDGKAVDVYTSVTVEFR